MYLFFTVLCRAPRFHWSILDNEIHLSGSRLYGMVLVCRVVDSSLYNKQNNPWTFGDREFIFSCSRSISMWTLEDKFHISARPCIILCLLNPFWNHWWSLQSDWLSAEIYSQIAPLSALNRISFSSNQNGTVKQNNQSDFKVFLN